MATNQSRKIVFAKLKKKQLAKKCFALIGNKQIEPKCIESIKYNLN